MSESIKLVKVSDVAEGAPLAIIAEGFPPLAVYRVQDKFFVTDNLCTHGNAYLTEGYQEGGNIECPFHGGAFDIATGKPTAYPCVVPLKTYEVVVEDGYVCIRRQA